MIQRILSVLYLIFFIVLSGYSAFFDPKPSPEPLWSDIAGSVFVVAGMVCMLLYILKIRPQRWVPLFKIIPIAMVATCGLSTYFQIRVDRSAPLVIVEAFITGSIILFPAWYMCFRFGYLKTLQDTSLRVFKWGGLSLFGLIFFTLLTVVTDHSPPAAHVALFIVKIIFFIIMVTLLYEQSKEWTTAGDNKHIPFQKSRSTSRTRKW